MTMISEGTRMKPRQGFDLGWIDPSWLPLHEGVCFMSLYDDGGGVPSDLVTKTRPSLAGAPSGYTHTPVGLAYQTETATALVYPAHASHQRPVSGITLLHYFQATGAFDSGGRVVEMPNGTASSWDLREDSVGNDDLQFDITTTSASQRISAAASFVAGDFVLGIGRWATGLAPTLDVLQAGVIYAGAGTALAGTIAYDTTDSLQIGRRERFTQEAPAKHIMTMVWDRRISDQDVSRILNDPFGMTRMVWPTVGKAPAVAGGRIMGALAGHGGLAGVGGLAGRRGGIAG